LQTVHNRDVNFYIREARRLSLQPPANPNSRGQRSNYLAIQNKTTAEIKPYQKQQIICYRCKATGHTASNCDKRKFLMRINTISDFETQHYSYSEPPKEDEYGAEIHMEEMDTHNLLDSDKEPSVNMLTTRKGQRITIKGRISDGPWQQMCIDTGLDLNVIFSKFPQKQVISNQTTLDKFARQADGSKIN
jgi:Zinc knuckle